MNNIFNIVSTIWFALLDSHEPYEVTPHFHQFERIHDAVPLDDSHM